MAAPPPHGHFISSLQQWGSIDVISSSSWDPWEVDWDRRAVSGQCCPSSCIKQLGEAKARPGQVEKPMHLLSGPTALFFRSMAV